VDHAAETATVSTWTSSDRCWDTANWDAPTWLDETPANLGATSGPDGNLTLELQDEAPSLS
jgi:hypothetical protein